MGDLGAAMQMMNNPFVQSILRQMVSDPELFRQVRMLLLTSASLPFPDDEQPINAADGFAEPDVSGVHPES